MSAPVAVTRTLALIEALAGNVMDGVRLAPLAAQLQQHPPTTFRDLQGLEALGYVERIPGRDDCWRLTGRICRIAHLHREEMARHRQRLDDIDRNYTRPPTTR
jgi:DNA-binding IclR family transcriptional regulator